jgi:hypothetical protein
VREKNAGVNQSQNIQKQRCSSAKIGLHRLGSVVGRPISSGQGTVSQTNVTSTNLEYRHFIFASLGVDTLRKTPTGTHLAAPRIILHDRNGKRVF